MIFGIVIGAVAVGLAAAVFYIRYKPADTSSLVAPYYQKEDFVPPKRYKPPSYIEIEKRTAVKIPIIMYHYVEYVKDVNDLVKRKLAINPYTFDLQLKTFKDYNYETYFVRDMPAIIDGKIKVSTRSAILTFDDGYEDFYTDVLPILKKYNMKATLYIIYDYIGRKGFLTSAEIKEIAKSDLVEIGGHTLDHVYLKQIPSVVLKRQVTDVKTLLESDYGIKVDTFAYPYGPFSDEAIQAVKTASYSAAVSVIPGVIHSKDTLFYMSRIRAGALVPGPSMVHFLDSY